MTLMKKNVIVSEKVRSYSSIFIRIYGYDEYILYSKKPETHQAFQLFSYVFHSFNNCNEFKILSSMVLQKGEES